MLASSSNCFAMRSFDSYSATAASTTRAPTATATVRPTSARSRLGEKSCENSRMRPVPRLEAGQDLLPLRTLHEVQEGLDRWLHLGGVRVRDEVERTADRVGAVRERVARRRDVVDRQKPHVRGAEGLRIHRHHADRVLERAEGLERLVDLEYLDGVFGVDGLRRAEEVRLEGRACRGFGL